jgi:ATP-dependent Clp protease ATP-binding subunit ClpA
MDFYNFFSFSAKKAIYRASEICGQFNNKYLEPEHIFYSIFNLRSCSASQVLHQLGVPLPKLTYSLEAYLYEHAGTYKGNAVFNQRTITLLDAAHKEVKRLHHKEIGTSHLLIALSQDRSVFLKSLFEEHGLNSKKIRDTYMVQLKQYEEPEAGIEIKRGAQQSPADQIVPPVSYDDTVKLILKNAQFTAQALGYEQLTPAHLLYSSCLYAVEWWGRFAEVGVEPHVVSGKLARMMRRDNAQQAEKLSLAPAACDVFGLAYALTLRGGKSTVSTANFLQAVLKSDDEQIKAVFADSPKALTKLVELLSTNEPSDGAQPPAESAAPPDNPEGYRESYDRIRGLLGLEKQDRAPNDSPGTDEPHAAD